MKRTILTAGLITLAAIVLLSSCIIVTEDSSIPRMNYDLRGTWETSPGASIYSASVEIGHDTIRITGILRPPPLDNFTGYSRLKGYSEETPQSWGKKEGVMYINDKDSWQKPVPYVLWEDALNNKFLTLYGTNSTVFVTLRRR